jgi:hypothetical protein
VDGGLESPSTHPPKKVIGSKKNIKIAEMTRGWWMKTAKNVVVCDAPQMKSKLFTYFNRSQFFKTTFDGKFCVVLLFFGGILKLAKNITIYCYS